MYLNSIMVCGNLSADAEVRAAGSKNVISLRVATTKKWNSNGQSKSRTEWFDVEFWPISAEQQAFLMTNLVKGSTVLVSGEMRFSSYEKQGVKVPSAVLVASDLNPLGRLQLQSANKAQGSAPAKPTPAAPAPSTPTAPSAPAGVVEHDATLAAGTARFRINAGGVQADMVMAMAAGMSLVVAGQATLVAIGPPQSYDKALPQSHAALPAVGEPASRPPLPSEEEVAGAHGFGAPPF